MKRPFGPSSERRYNTGMDVPVELARIIITELGQQQVIFLRELDGERMFPIMIGISEALAIDRRLKGIPMPRPMTHDLLEMTIDALGGELQRVIIRDLEEFTFYATIEIRQDDKIIQLDARPSDAIALAVRTDTPLFAAEHVVRNASKEPTTKAERIGILRKRQTALAEQITTLSELLEDEDFLEQLPYDEIVGHRESLTEMQVEYDAIDEILRKLG